MVFNLLLSKHNRKVKNAVKRFLGRGFPHSPLPGGYLILPRPHGRGQSNSNSRGAQKRNMSLCMLFKTPSRQTKQVAGWPNSTADQ